MSQCMKPSSGAVKPFVVPRSWPSASPALPDELSLLRSPEVRRKQQQQYTFGGSPSRHCIRYSGPNVCSCKSIPLRMRPTFSIAGRCVCKEGRCSAQHLLLAISLKSLKVNRSCTQQRLLKPCVAVCGKRAASELPTRRRCSLSVQSLTSSKLSSRFFAAKSGLTGD